MPANRCSTPVISFMVVCEVRCGASRNVEPFPSRLGVKAGAECVVRKTKRGAGEDEGAMWMRMWSASHRLAVVREEQLEAANSFH